MIIAIPVLFAASVAFLEITSRMYQRSLVNTGNDIDEQIQKEGCKDDLSRCIKIMNAHYADNDKNWRWRRR
jgi:hypothetical protein